MTQTLSHTLTLNHFFLTLPEISTRRPSSPWLHCGSLPIKQFLQETRPKRSDYPAGFSDQALSLAPEDSLPDLPLPLSIRLSFWSNSSLQTGFSLRSAGRTLMSEQGTDQSEASRKSHRWCPAIDAQPRSVARTNESSDPSRGGKNGRIQRRLSNRWTSAQERRFILWPMRRWEVLRVRLMRSFKRSRRQTKMKFHFNGRRKYFEPMPLCHDQSAGGKKTP